MKKENIIKIVKFLKNKILYIVLVIIIISLGSYVKSLPKNTIKVSFPYTKNIASNTDYACESLVSSSIIGSPEEYLTNGIEGSVEKGTDKIAMSIKDESTLVFQTAASISVGITEGDSYLILQNNSSKLLAVWFNEYTVSTVVINKENGLALWLKGSPDYITYGAPYGSVIYMICR
jgi:hypothetical protein